MLVIFNADSELACVAADAANIASAVGSDEQPWRRSRSPSSATVPRTQDHLNRPSAPRIDRETIERLLHLAIVGDSGDLSEVLLPDASGWSPSLEFSSRAEAEAALQDSKPTLQIQRFRIERIWWSDIVAFAEWYAEAVPIGPLLVGEDVLIEPGHRRVSIVGATAADLVGDRIAAIHTYFDEARLIEQLILGAVDGRGVTG
jgi:hypothetical protein